MSATNRPSCFNRLAFGFKGFSHEVKTRIIVPLLFLGALSASAQNGPGSTLYQLGVDTSFERGCFPPCMCPVMIGESVSGTFLLTPIATNSLYTTFAVSDVKWLVAFDGTNHIVTGSGTYQIGGEFALQQELSLELQVDGGAAEHFDSGLVAGPAPFPEIKVSISQHGMVCFDTVFNVSAGPAPVTHTHPFRLLPRSKLPRTDF